MGYGDRHPGSGSNRSSRIGNRNRGWATTARRVSDYVEIEVVEPVYGECVVREKVPAESLGHWLKQMLGMADTVIERVERCQVGETVTVRKEPTGEYRWEYGGRI